MLVLLDVVILCGLLSLIAYLGTGSDEKNLRSFSSYPEKIKERIRKNPAMKGKFKEGNPVVTFVSNLVIFGIIMFLLGMLVRTESFWMNFLYLNIIGQGANVFDLVVLDMLWWRNSKRTRISGTEDMHKEYQDITPHVGAFLRAIAMFAIVAAVDGILLTLF